MSGDSPAELEPDALMAAATAATGLDDFGDPRFREGFTRYLTAVEQESKLTDMGREIVAGDVVLNLTNRLRFEDDLKTHPEILEEEILPPVLITGLMRTGTTKLLQVLSTDPGVWSLKFWQAVNPAPFRDAPQDGADPRITFAEQVAAMTAEASPAMMSAHPPLPLEAEEELYLQRFTYCSIFNGLIDFTPSYMWWVADHVEYSYEYLYKLLQYLQWQQGGGQGRPWVLKSPWHLGNLDQVVRTFPGVTVVQAHRDPSDAVPSMSRLFDIVHRNRGNQATALMEGDFWLAFSAAAMRRGLALRDELGARLDVVDVAYRDVLGDITGVLREVYARSGRDLTPEIERGARDWVEGHPKDRFGRNQYSMEEFGLTRERIAAEFSDYLDRFGELVTP